MAASAVSANPPEWFILRDTVVGDPLCVSTDGSCYNRIGCFPLGMNFSIDDFQEIIFSQRNLKKLELLDVVPAESLRNYGDIFNEFNAQIHHPFQDAIQTLAINLMSIPNEGFGRIQIVKYPSKLACNDRLRINSEQSTT